LNSALLSARTKQPGDDQTFVTSETNLFEVTKGILGPGWTVTKSPADLMKVINGRWGIKPDVKVTNDRTGRRMFLECKKQGKTGNAYERAFRHHAPGFQARMKEIYGYSYHPFRTVFCEDLASLDCYKAKHEFFFEPGSYLCWTDYDQEILALWLDEQLEPLR
jgi:hypothetical protein